MSMVRGQFTVRETPDKWVVVDREDRVVARWNAYEDAVEDAMHRNALDRGQS